MPELHQLLRDASTEVLFHERLAKPSIFCSMSLNRSGGLKAVMAARMLRGGYLLDTSKKLACSVSSK